MTSRPSLEFQQEQERVLQASNNIKSQFDQVNANLRLLRNPIEFSTLNSEESGIDFEGSEHRDPSIVSANLVAQTQFLRKLKFQFLEQNAKDRYVKSIVSDIDDAPIVTAADIKEREITNGEKKAELKAAKTRLAELHHNIRTLSPLVQEDYDKAKAIIDRSAAVAQQIIDTRLKLTRLRQTHPQPRLTIATAEQKAEDQIREMQELSDQVEAVRKHLQKSKEEVKTGNVELERARANRAEAEKLVKIKAADVREDDPRLEPLYEWFTASLQLHRDLRGLVTSESVSDNEVRLAYQVERNKLVEITLVFLPNTHQLATVDVSGIDSNLSELTDTYIQTNDSPGLIAALLSRARNN
ncbi:hypothetical protein AGABI1DRAFT_103100 [Agaricus bisporus var. burnettii JB137-S8]|uniref:Kinetochore protein Sos7 coiled-coil domain-containing protein n=1 Tax=Agaricus bisporus var. burnettii (strain JB137-S8 / ATCC MYA-4627 / FGSC 10392) TaxID=597362 RepID=K5XKZ3_AGABU|nr:uncharacterized protein AGABI1DRAFT_103100 [Agaricus bisporus var. burnettii JB137-S8]EKM75165.1 hypothetical protein AGABI1DRAFT_103100 [Agaricus bisporus var. burnettii JB137-S8]